MSKKAAAGRTTSKQNKCREIRREMLSKMSYKSDTM